MFFFIAFFTGILGLIIGGPFRVLVIENQVIESVILRLIFGFLFFPAVVGIALMLGYYFFAENANLRPEHWGAIFGLVCGMSCSWVIIGRSRSEDSKNT